MSAMRPPCARPWRRPPRRWFFTWPRNRWCRESYAQPRETFEINIMGTVNLLEAVRALGQPCVVVVVTSDKCYENREHLWGYREMRRAGRPRSLQRQQGRGGDRHGRLSPLLLPAAAARPSTA